MIRFTSCMAPNMESLCQKVADLAAVELGVRTAFVGDISWKERERRFFDGMIDVVWICGLPYVLDWDENTDGVSLLADPCRVRCQVRGSPRLLFRHRGQEGQFLQIIQGSARAALRLQ